MAEDSRVGQLEVRLQELEKQLKDARDQAAGLRGRIDLFNAITANTTLPIFLKTADFKYLFINRQFELLAGSTNEKIQGKTDYDVFPREIADLFRGQDEEVLRGKEKVEFEETVSLPAGELTFITSKFPVFGQDGNITAVGGICTDITNAKKTEQALRESEEKLKNLFDSCRTGIFAYSLEQDGRLVFTEANRAASEIVGVDCSQYVGKTIEEAFPALAETRIPEHFRRACSDGTPLQTEQITYEDDKIEGAYEIYAFQTVPGKVAVMFRDITERKQADERLRMSEELFRSLVENIPAGVTLIDSDMNILAMNRQMQKWFPEVDVKRKSVCYQAFNDPPREAVCTYCPVVKTFEDGQIHESTKDTPTSDGIKHYRVVSTPIRDAEGKVDRVVEIVEDITERLQMEEELHRAKKIEAIGLLAGGIAHDFNNVMTSILGNISLAKRLVDADSKAYARLAATEDATQRAQDLTTQLLTFSRGGAPLLKTVFIENTVRRALDFVLKRVDVSLNISCGEDICPVEADERQIGQVIQNIGANAVEAMAGDGRLDVTIENCQGSENNGLSHNPGRYVRITIQDQGPGIPDKSKDKVFDPFYTTKKGGSGLGLAISYSIVKKHEGLISCEAGENAGARFSIYLPASDKIPEQVVPSRKKVVRGGGRILVMDDNENVLETLSEMLTHMGYQVETASEGGEAVSLYQEALDENRRFDAVVLDLTVPGGMGGSEAMQHIRALDPRARGIVSSGYDSSPVMKEPAKHGFAGVVKKPFRLGNLSRIVGDAVRPGEEN